MAELNLGKVRITFGGDFDSSKAYELLTVVNDPYGIKYISKQNVPIGSSLSNTTYWEPLTGIFSETYQGSYSDDPSKRTNGGDLQIGDVCFNTTDNRLKVYTGSKGWKYVSESVNGLLKRFNATGDGTTTSFTVDGGYNADMGVVMLNSADVTNEVDISDGSSIKFNTAPANGSKISAYFFNSFQLADAMSVSGDNEIDGDIFFKKNIKGIILTDRSNSKKYRLYVNNGNLGIEEA